MVYGWQSDVLRNLLHSVNKSIRILGSVKEPKDFEGEKDRGSGEIGRVCVFGRSDALF